MDNNTAVNTANISSSDIANIQNAALIDETIVQAVNMDQDNLAGGFTGFLTVNYENQFRTVTPTCLVFVSFTDSTGGSCDYVDLTITGAAYTVNRYAHFDAGLNSMDLFGINQTASAVYTFTIYVLKNKNGRR